MGQPDTISLLQLQTDEIRRLLNELPQTGGPEATRFAQPAPQTDWSACPPGAFVSNQQPSEVQRYADRVLPGPPPNVKQSKDAILQYQIQISNLLDQNRGLAIGEEHWTTSIPNFLRENLQFYHSKGVDTIYIEAVDAKYNSFIQKYYNNPTKDNLEAIRPIFNDPACSPSNRAELLSLIEAARKEGIRVVGIDEHPRPISDHLDSINDFWVDQIKADQASRPKGGKFIVHGGTLHIRGFTGLPDNPRDYVDHTTVPQKLNIPYMTIEIDYTLSGNQIKMVTPPERSMGELDISLSPDFKTTG
jgi:hypothetical protein